MGKRKVLNESALKELQLPQEGERGDILWRYTLPQTDWLKQNNHIPKDF